MRFDVLDGMRGLAAIIVMLGHYYVVGSPRLFFNSYIAIDLFFVLSGFVLTHAYAAKLGQAMNIADYLWRRILRLYPAMALSVLVGLPSFWWATKQGQTDYSVTDMVKAAALNLLFLPSFLNSHIFYDGLSMKLLFPINTSLWSLFFEVVGSVAFLGLVRLSNKALFRLLMIFFLLAFTGSLAIGMLHHRVLLEPNGGYTPGNFFQGFPRVLFGFSCGILLYRLRLAPTRHPVLNWLQMLAPLGGLWVYVVCVAMLLFPFRLSGFYYFPAIILLCPWLIMEGAKSECENKTVQTISQRLGRISYPVYCLHEPVLDGIRILRLWMGMVESMWISTEMLSALTTLAVSYLGTSLLRHIGWKRERESAPIFRSR